MLFKYARKGRWIAATPLEQIEGRGREEQTSPCAFSKLIAIDRFIPFIQGSSLRPSGGGGGRSCVGVYAGENSLGMCMFEESCLEQGNSHLVGHGVVERLGDPVEEAHA